MASGYVWCRYCGEPHAMGLAQCPTTRKELETRIHRPPSGAVDAGIIEGRYRLRELIGEGANGRVFFAEDLARRGKAVAIKIQKGDAGRGSRRLEQEGKLALSVAHPHICRVLGYGRLRDGRRYIVMEALLNGETLQKLLARVRVLDESLAVTIAIQLLSGLAVVHKLGIVHRDVKPSNVFLANSTDGEPMVKLLDFGLAKPPADMAMVHTRPGYTFGTPGYIAPELFHGRAATARSDVWGVGVVLFEMLAGVRPFRTDREAGSPYAVLTEPARSLAVCAPHVPARLARIVEIALSSDPRERYESADALRERLMSYASQRPKRSTSPAVLRAAKLPVIEYTSSSTTSSTTGSSFDIQTVTAPNEPAVLAADMDRARGPTATPPPARTPRKNGPRR